VTHAWLPSKEEFQSIKYLTDNIMGKIKVTQTRSKIKRPEDQKRTLLALGLKKMGQSVEHDATPSVLGMVDKVKHLISVEKL
jgi:large subunit ribosomal protein L30